MLRWFFVLLLLSSCLASPDDRDVGHPPRSPDAEFVEPDGGLDDAGTAVDVGVEDGGVPWECDLSVPLEEGPGNGVLSADTCAYSLQNCHEPYSALELGHTLSINFLERTATRVLSQDAFGHWILWDVRTRVPLLQGLLTERMRLAGQTLVAKAGSTLRIWSAETGGLQAEIPAPERFWNLSSDGLYVWTVDAARLNVWSAAGVNLINRPGNYAGAAIAYGEPGELRIVKGPAGDNVVETLSIDSGAVKVSPPFSGAFLAWFLDGSHFFTTLSSSTWIYSKDAVQEAFLYLPNRFGLNGHGTFYWVRGALYRLGQPDAVATDLAISTENLFPAGKLLGLLRKNVRTVEYLESTESGVLRWGPFPVPTDHDVSTMALDAEGHWSVGTIEGALFDETDARFGCGAVRSIAGNGNGRAVVVTASGENLVLDVSGVRPKVEGSLTCLANFVGMSEDGTLLVVSGSANRVGPQCPRRAYRLPSWTLLGEWEAALGQTVRMSRGGTRLSHMKSVGLELKRYVTDLSGGLVEIERSGGGAWFHLSPDGTLAAYPDTFARQSGATVLYRNGVAYTAVPGYGIGWLDDGRLLALSWDSNSRYTGARVYSPEGTLLATLPLPPELLNIQKVGTDWIYSPELHAIYDLRTGAQVWKSSHPTDRNGAVTGGRIVYASGWRLFAEPYSTGAVSGALFSPVLK
jgi:hypothetical protein